MSNPIHPIERQVRYSEKMLILNYIERHLKWGSTLDEALAGIGDNKHREGKRSMDRLFDQDIMFEQVYEYLRMPHTDDAAYNLQEVHKIIGIDVPDYLEVG